MVGDETTNAVTWFDMEAGSFMIPRITGSAPRPCLSAEAFVFGHYFVTYGGWSTRGLIGSLHVLDLNRWDVAADGELEAQPPTEATAHPFQGQHGSLMAIFMQMMGSANS